MIPINKSKKHSFPKDERGWVAFVNDIHDSGVNRRQGEEAQWARNIAYYFGFQHLMYDTTTKLIQVDYGKSDQYIINRIAAFVDQRLAKLTRARPTTGIVPDGDDPERIKAAETSEFLSKHLWKVLKKDEKLDLATLQMILMGSSFKKTCWEPDGGEPVLDEQDPEGNIMFDEITGKQKPYITHLGDLGSYTRDAFSILASPGCTNLDDSLWVMDRGHRPVQEIIDKFSDFDVNRIVTVKDEMTRYEKFVNSLTSPVYGHGVVTGNPSIFEASVKDHELLLVKELWLKPNYVYEDGLLITVVCDQLLQFDKWPYDHREFPFSKMDEHINPFGFYGKSTVTRLIPIQRNYNQQRTQTAKNAEVMANVKWWVPKGAGLADDALTDEEGEVVETNPNVPMPQQLGVAPLPNYMMQVQQQDIMDFRDVGGERSVDQQPFANLTAGVAIETMAELADIGLGPTIKNMERAMIREIRQELMLANQFYTDERVIKVFGKASGDFKTMIVKSTDLLNQTDVSIQLESSLGQSKAAARQNLIDMWDRRIIVDPDLFLQAFAAGDLEIATKKKDKSREVVIEQIMQIKEGAQPIVTPFDNHIVHIGMLSEFIQTPEFRRLAPDRQQIGMQTLQQHLAFMQPQQQAQEENQAAVGTPYGDQITEGM